jgi:NAD(P)-dependent dehydrogenase (short-subunit alcohol dehydrogenase family)
LTEKGTAIVTGAARRIGRSIAKRLAREGYSLALHFGASGEEAEGLAAEIVKAGGRAKAFQADLADVEAAMQLVGQVAGRLGPATLLVNNAATFEPDEIDTLDYRLWRRQFAVNLETPVFLASEFARLLPEGRRGSIVNIIDQRVLRLNPINYSYTLAKSALWTATQTLAQALAPRIRVNAVGPGPTFPNQLEGEKGLDREAAGTLMGRRIEGAEIADAVVWLTGAESVTGQMILVDGGQHLEWRPLPPFP